MIVKRHLNLINKLVLEFFPKYEKEFDTEEELEILADLGEEKGGLEEEESDMIRSIIKFDDKKVREIEYLLNPGEIHPINSLLNVFFNILTVS